MKHTPGPWKLTRHATNHQTLTGAAPGLIADIHKDEDAALIAAAPAMLEALRLSLKVLDRLALDDDCTEGQPEAQHAARAAIAQAKGRV